MNRELVLFSRNIIQDSFVKLYFPHDDMHRVVHFEEGAGPHFNRKTIFVYILQGFPIIKISWSPYHPFFTMEMPTLLKQNFYYEMATGFCA